MSEAAEVGKAPKDAAGLVDAYAKSMELQKQKSLQFAKNYKPAAKHEAKEDEDFDLDKFPVRKWSITLPWLTEPIAFNPVVCFLVGVSMLWGLAIWCMFDPEGSPAELTKWRSEITLYFSSLFTGTAWAPYLIAAVSMGLAGRRFGSPIMTFSLFLAICGAATAYHAVSQVVSITKKLTGNNNTTNEDSKKKLIVISGCDSGFGYLLAEALLKETNYLVLALALTEKGVHALRSLNDDEGKSSPRLFAARCDVTSDGDVKRVGEATREILEEQDAVLYSIVNNAGIASAGDFLFYRDISTYQKVMDVNFFGHLRITQALLPFMLETSRKLTEHPRIVNISSVCGVSVSPSNSTYNASKYALEAWSDTIRLELEPFHIKVVKIRPGQMSTQIQKDWPTTYLDNFAKAPPAIHELYGGSAFEQEGAKKYVLKFISDGSAASPPEIVIDALLNTLTMRHSQLKPAYFVGADAQTLWRALGVLPTSVTDSVKRLIRFKYPVVPTEVPV